MAFPLPPKPRVLIEDLRSFARRRDRHNWVALGLAVAIPCFIVWLFVLDARTGILPEGPVITYVESWPLDRSDEEIIARQRELALAANERRAARREQFQRLADELGIDYDREAAAEADRITEENRETLSAAAEAPADEAGAGADAAER